MNRFLRHGLLLLFILFISGCASSSKSVEIKMENNNDLPAIADLADASAARIVGSVLTEEDLGRRIRIHLAVSEVKARGSVAPPLKPGKCIEITIPRSKWMQQIAIDTSNKKALALTIKYAGKPKSTRASSAWTWVKFHKN